MSKNTYYSSFNLEDIDKIATELITFSQRKRLWLFYGDLGAGKTTIIKALCRCLDVKSNITSATYPIINEYLDKNNTLVYHCDFYRIIDSIEAIDIGCEDILYGNNYCFVEWPSRIESLLPKNNISVYMSYESEYTRCIRAFLNE